MPFSSFISPHGKSFSVTSWIIRHVNNARYSVKASTNAFSFGDNLFNIYDCDMKVLVGSLQTQSNIVYTCLYFMRTINISRGSLVSAVRGNIDGMGFKVRDVKVNIFAIHLERYISVCFIYWLIPSLSSLSLLSTQNPGENENCKNIKIVLKSSWCVPKFGHLMNVVPQNGIFSVQVMAAVDVGRGQ